MSPACYSFPALIGLLLLSCGNRATQEPTRPVQIVAAPCVEPTPEHAEETASDAPTALAEPAPLEDEVEAPVAEPAETIPTAHPLDDVSDEQVSKLVEEDLASLGSMSLGRPNSGRLVNGVPMPKDEMWEIVDASHAYGTEETIEYLRRAIRAVNERFANTPPAYVGHISGPKGGYLSPHLSHQSGRDVDLGYYYLDGGTWYQRATKETLDVERTWALVRALITETDVRFLLIDHSIQRLLREHAERIGEDRAWLDNIFDGRGNQEGPLIRHVRGHQTHLHVRFYNPIAQETARRCYRPLVAQGLVKPPTHYIWHKAKKGDSLIKLAKIYRTTVRAIQRANGLRSTKIFAKKSYKIPRQGPAAQGARVSIPKRRTPPGAPRVTLPHSTAAREQ